MNSADLDPDEPTATQIHDWTAQEPQDVQPGPIPSPKDKPTNYQVMYNQSKEEFNRILQETYAYFRHKLVRIPDGRVGKVVGVDCRPMKGVPTSVGQDGNYLVISIPYKKAPAEHVWQMPDQLTVVDNLNGKEIKT